MVVRDEMMMRVNAMEIRGLLENQRGEGLGRGRKKDEDEAQHASSEFSVVRTRVVAGLRRCCCLQIDRGGGGVTNHELSCLGNGQARVIGKARTELGVARASGVPMRSLFCHRTRRGGMGWRLNMFLF